MAPTLGVFDTAADTLAISYAKCFIFSILLFDVGFKSLRSLFTVTLAGVILQGEIYT
jgi:hypothetical protein